MPETSPLHPPVLAKSLKKQWWIAIPVLICAVIAAGLLTALQLAQVPQDLTKQAAPATSLALTTVADPVVINQVFTVPITVTTGPNLARAVDIALNYDPTVLQLQDVTAGPWLIQATVVTKKIDQANGEALVSLVIPPTAQPNYVTNTGVAAIATFKAIKANSRTTVSFNRPLSVVGAANETQNAVTNYSDVSLTVLSDDQLPVDNNVVVYSYEPCMPTHSDGHALFIIWKTANYPGATTIDVSNVSDFSSYADKSVAGASVTLSGWSAMDGTNFRTTSAGGTTSGQFFAFNPDLTYYFRINYNNGTHSGVLAYKPAACSTSPVVRQCNDSCNVSSDCGTNLVCSNNKCRRDGNVSDTQCFLPPDKGIKRSCNEYCADSNECGSGLTCWYNQCRNPKDVTLANCKLPLAAGEVESCNRYCADTSECSGGLTCWYNQCRLAQNLKNDKCQVPQPTRTNSSSSTNASGSAATSTSSRTNARLTPTPTGQKVVAKVVIDPTSAVVPTAAFPTRVLPTTRPTTRPTLIPTTVPLPPASNSPMKWIPVLISLIVVVTIVLLVWPKIQSILNPPRARVMPPKPVTTTSSVTSTGTGSAAPVKTTTTVATTTTSTATAQKAPTAASVISSTSPANKKV